MTDLLNEYGLLELIVVSMVYLCLAFPVAVWGKYKLEGTALEIPAKIFLILFVIGDWLWNLIGATIIFLDPPEELFELTTGRMKRYTINYSHGYTLNLLASWRYGFAIRLCRFLNQWDKDHC